MKKRTQVVLGIVLGLTVFGMILPEDKKEEPKEPVKVEAKKEVKEEIKKEPEKPKDPVEEWINSQFGVEGGLFDSVKSHIPTTEYIKGIVVSPDSVELIQTVNRRENNDLIVRCNFKCKNKFGVVLEYTILTKSNYDNKTFEVVEFNEL